ncbi:MAG: hypothetical protein JXR97_01150 [Planctomycetes bacterium]|nr:hypothetical protein [Planctomycetota bacterium]
MNTSVIKNRYAVAVVILLGLTIPSCFDTEGSLHFDESMTSYESCANVYCGDYLFHYKKPPPVTNEGTSIIVTKDSNTIHELDAHSDSPFCIAEGRYLVYVVAPPYASGGKIFCFDLTQRKILWQQTLKGLPKAPNPELYDVYLNLFNINVSKSNKIIVKCKETCGAYMEVFDLMSGKRLKHKVVSEKTRFEATLRKASSGTN